MAQKLYVLLFYKELLMLNWKDHVHILASAVFVGILYGVVDRGVYNGMLAAAIFTGGMYALLSVFGKFSNALYIRGDKKDNGENSSSDDSTQS